MGDYDEDSSDTDSDASSSDSDSDSTDSKIERKIRPKVYKKKLIKNENYIDENKQAELNEQEQKSQSG